MLSFFSSVKWIVIAVIIAGVGFAGWYITGLRAELAVAKQNVATLQKAVETNEAAIAELHSDFNKNAIAIRQVTVLVNTQNRELTALRDRFNVSPTTGAPRDVGSIARQRPASVERLVNRGTEYAMRCVELASGAPHTAEELAARLPSEINNICPSLANPGYTP